MYGVSKGDVWLAALGVDGIPRQGEYSKDYYGYQYSESFHHTSSFRMNLGLLALSVLRDLLLHQPKTHTSRRGSVLRIPQTISVSCVKLVTIASSLCHSTLKPERGPKRDPYFADDGAGSKDCCSLLMFGKTHCESRRTHGELTAH